MKIQAKSPKRTVTRGFASRTAEFVAPARTLPLCTRTPRRANMCAALLDGSSRTARAWIQGSPPSQVSPTHDRTNTDWRMGSDVTTISPRNLCSTRRRCWLGKSARPHPCYTGLLKSALTLVEDTCSRPGCPTPTPDPDNWWKCPRDGSPCKWLALENNKTPKSLAATGSERKVLPNPNVPVANYKYPFDTWVTTWPDDDLEIYIKGEKVRPQASGTRTSGDDVYYKSSRGTQIQFYGACSPDTPCTGEEVVPWTQGKAVTVADRDAVIDVSKYTSDGDLVFTIADTSVTTEQYTILADGKEVGKTHGRPTLGTDKYNTKNIANVDVGAGPWGALRSIANDGFWGSFRIPKGTQQVTVHMNFEGPGWPYYLFEYRIDKLCKC
ncbi:hypothetical protein VFPFJ_11103 [Purpureocillium lilacinum]|uniref:Uncharacterized protein n=1 Tax=Purpureocillium lilacinum TaxID=33203 RepID=A0A179FPJ7_PURLI|nr:hypothetical protein VFPFJ_11103 [Purpureocillium lilacinum]OAQ67514.1 hypothetical protein VFPFJ_11103 [Purpureocillium lilacinum]